MGRVGSKLHPRRHCPVAIGSPRHMSRSTRQPIPRRFDMVWWGGGRWPRFRGQAKWRVGGQVGWAPGGHGRARCHRHHIVDTHISERARMSALRPITHNTSSYTSTRLAGGAAGRGVPVTHPGQRWSAPGTKWPNQQSSHTRCAEPARPRLPSAILACRRLASCRMPRVACIHRMR